MLPRIHRLDHRRTHHIFDHVDARKPEDARQHGQQIGVLVPKKMFDQLVCMTVIRAHVARFRLFGELLFFANFPKFANLDGSSVDRDHWTLLRQGNGRTPMTQGEGGDGRDHHPNAFTMWMAGGGLKKGITYGESDELGFNVVDGEVHVRDLHATILHLLGLDHVKLSYRVQGLDQRLTGVEEARVVKEILA